MGEDFERNQMICKGNGLGGGAYHRQQSIKAGLKIPRK